MQPAVIGGHRDYLLTRDLATLALLFLISLGGAVAFSPVEVAAKVGYPLLLAAVYLATRQSAKNYGERLVCTVLAEETST